MPLSSAERKKRYIEKLKAEDKFDEYKAKNAAVVKQKRQRTKVGLEALPKNVRERTKRLNREYTRRKAAEFRLRQKEEKGKHAKTTNNSVFVVARSDTDDGSYKTTSALAKAAAKIKSALPSNHQKQKQAISKVLKMYDSKDIQEIVAGMPRTADKPKRTKGITFPVIKIVQNFYEKDDISRMSPNVKDCRKFTNPVTGIKESKQLRFLLYKLEDVYGMFVKHIQNGDCAKNPPVRFSKFCALRPSHVKLVGSISLDQCLCFYHSNFILCCAAINRHTPEFPNYGPQLEKLILCRNPVTDCWLRKCSKCPIIRNTLEGIVERSGKSKVDSVSCIQWFKNDETKRFQKLVRIGTFEDLLECFVKILPEFLRHSYVKRNQAKSFEDDNEEVKRSDGKVATLQVDFAESFNCDAQDEIQSAHWNQASV